MFTLFRQAFRSLAKTPGYTAVAVITLALGIGISTGSFSTTNAFLLRALPFPQSEELVRIFHTSEQEKNGNHSPGAVLEMRDALKSVVDFTPYYYDLTSISEPGQPPEQVGGITAGVNLLEALRVKLVIGPGFSPENEQEGKGDVVIITDQLWRKRFASDPKVIGRTLRIAGEQTTIVGVLPATFRAPLIWNDAQFIRPWVLYSNYRTLYKPAWLSAFARLKPGLTLAQFNGELAAFAAQMAEAHPEEYKGEGLRAVGFASSNMGGINTTLIWLVSGLACAVLLVACANLASLQLARSFGRSREFAIRSALGGGRLQLMAPLLCESLLLALAGGVFGLIIASWTNEYMSASLKINNEPGFDISLDGRVLLFAAVTSLLTGLAFGVVPAWLASRTPASNALKEGARGSTGGPAHNRLRLGLVVAEIALSLVLVAVASGFAVASRNLLNRDLGWEPEGVFQASFNRPYSRYPDAPKMREFDRVLLERLSAIPGVDQVSLSTALPLFSYFRKGKVAPEGFQESEHSKAPVVELDSVSEGYFKLLHIPVLEGEGFSSKLAPDGPAVALVSQNFAERFWPGESAVGRRIRLEDEKDWVQIVGVVGKIRMGAGLGAPASPYQIYRPLEQQPSNFMSIALRGTASPTVLTKECRRIILEIDPDLPLLYPATVREWVAGAMANLDVIVVNLGIYAIMALLISGIGIYGVISHVTAQRTRDIGVRMALGACQQDIVKMILLQGVKLLLLGLLVGVLLTTVVMKLVASSLSDFDLPGAWLQAVTVCVLSVVTLLACYLPARRASRIDPVEALRAD